MGQPLPAADHILRIRLLGSVNGQNWASIQYAQFTGAEPDSTALSGVASGLATAYLNAIATLAAPTTVLHQVEVIDLSKDTAAQAAHAQEVIGTRAGTALPNNLAVVASYHINRRYRGGHPRTYWPVGVTTDITSGNRISGTFLPLCENGMSAWVGNVNNILLNSVNLHHGCLSYYTRDPNNPGHSMLRDKPVFDITQSVAVHGRFDSQRRRLGREIQ